MDYTKNQILEVEINDMGEHGEGIGKVDGYTLFVKDAVPGDFVKAKLTKVKKNYSYARLEEIITPSPDRVTARCAFHRQCGGCQLQALSYEAQLKFKEKKVKNDMVRIGGFNEGFIESIMEPVIGMENPFRYRNKAQFPVKNVKGRIITGFYAGRTHDVIENTDCVLGVKENEEILKTIISFMEDEKVSAYDENTGSGIVRHILIRKGFKTGELMVCLVINADRMPHADKLIERLSKIENVKSISISINKKNTNVILGEKCKTLWGSDTIEDYIGNLKFKISPHSFYQVNPVQTEKLYSKALEYAELSGDENVWDLYCGIGTISLFLAQKAGHVTGVEIVPEAIEDAKENALANELNNTEFYVGAAEDIAPVLLEKGNVPDVIVVDPPRKGCDGALLDTIISVMPKKVVYVSCDPATLSRDVKVLCENGYEMKKICPVDQFGHTVHCEVVTLLSKSNRKADSHIKLSLDMDEYYGIIEKEQAENK